MATLQQLAEHLGAKLEGDGSAISRVSGFADATADSVVFAVGDAALAQAASSAAGAVLTDSQAVCAKPTLRVRDARLAFARAAKLLAGDHAEASDPQIHPTAVLGQNVTLGAGMVISAGCVVGDGVVLGAQVHLYPRVVIYPGCTLGERVIVHAGAVLGADGFGYARDPESGEYIAFPQQGTLVIEDDVEIGANSTIDRGALGETRIGVGTKIDNLVHIAHNVTIGRNVVIAAQTGISGSSSIGDGAVLGGQVGIGDHARVGPGVILGGQGGVLPHKSVEGAGQMFWGTPARPIQQYLRELATLSKLARKKKDG
jgi:UDP-3-O-[3-hydroxymyristoyl] glucosamine N-acyltransferase